MSKFDDLEYWKPKALRTLRNNLNNRIASFKNSGGKPGELKPSHKLHGLEQSECEELLIKTQRLLKEIKSAQ